jgi:23S rRNA (guanosine2251-2'-O)-methyltransferase
MKREEEGLLYGLKPVLEALRSTRRGVTRIALQRVRTGRETDEIFRLAREQGVPIRPETREALDQIAGTPKHQGVVAWIRGTGAITLESILQEAEAKGEPSFLAVLDGVEDPRNLGAILRTGDAVGLHGVIIPQRRAVGLTATVGKTSAGALEHVRVAQVSNIVKTLEQLRKEGIWLVGLEAEAKKSYLDFDYAVPIALVIGGEGKGIRPLALSSCDETVSIPMRGSIASLNMSVAFAILAYEVVRQRSQKT